MRTLRKYTGFLAKIHTFALIFSFLFSYATPQNSRAFAQDQIDGIKVLHAPLEPEAIEGEFLVQFKSTNSLINIDKGEKPAWLSKLGKGVEIDTSLKGLNIAHVKMANPTSSGQWENLSNILSSDPNIHSVEPNYMVYALGPIANDPYANELWHLDNISASKAWKNIAKATKEDIVVAVIDTGIQFDHEDLRGHIWKNPKEIAGNRIDDDDNGYVDDVVGWNFRDGNKYSYSYLTPYPVITQDPDSGRYSCTAHPTKKRYETHGTHVAGIIAAVRNNYLGIAGVADRVKIMPVKALGGPCGGGSSMSILRAVHYAVEQGARIINMSLGGYGHTTVARQLYQALSDKGVLIIAAAGNEHNDNDSASRSYPASYPAEGIISVAASDPDNKLTEFSNYGKRHVDLAAPGIDILSTIPRGTDERPESGYVAYPGTSMAAPIVTGAAALLLAQNPRLTNLQLKQKLLASVDKIPTLADKVSSGGRLNLYKALSQHTTIVSDDRPSRKEPITHSREERGNVGGIRIFDTRSNSQKW